MSKKIEKEIIKYLNENGPSFLGEVVKELKLSYSRGLEHILRLHSKGIIRRTNPPLQYELEADSK